MEKGRERKGKERTVDLRSTLGDDRTFVGNFDEIDLIITPSA